MDSEPPVYGEIPEFRRRLIECTGLGFLLGAGGGSAFYFIKGICSSPTDARLVGAVRAVRTNVPRVAGTCGAFLGVCDAFERAMSLARRREDPWNSVVSTPAAAVLFRMHRGAPAAARSALLAVTVVVGGIWVNRTVDLLYIRLTFIRESLSNTDPPEPAVVTSRPTVDGSGESKI
ncbi:hypothetical protein QOZ80_8BG0659210 [Eleusine coracana subsp. coracana]|nr:hypothetical protein QOZ80_8BG0659210 [Eleusine coracana subsp. coracana]